MFSKELILVAIFGILLAGILISSNQWYPTVQQVLKGDQPTLGVEDAPVTIVEFAEFYSPFWARYLGQIFPQIKEQYIETGKVKYVFRNLVLDGESAYLASKAGECAHRQGHFWKFRDRMFEVAFKERKEHLSKKNLIELAKELGLDDVSFKVCLESEELDREIQRDQDTLEELIRQLPENEKKKAGEIRVPTFFINGHILIGVQQYSDFKKIIQKELEKS